MCEVWGRRIKKMEKEKCERDLTVGPTVWDWGKTQNTHVSSEGHLTDLETYFFVCKPKFDVMCHTAQGAKELCKATWPEPYCVTSRYFAPCPGLCQDLFGWMGLLRQPLSPGFSFLPVLFGGLTTCSSMYVKGAFPASGLPCGGRRGGAIVFFCLK